MPVTQVPDIDRIMPELLLTITGVLTMLIEPVMPAGMSRKPIGFLALAGVIVAVFGMPSARRAEANSAQAAVLVEM